MRFVLSLLLLACLFPAKAQKKDSVFVKQVKDSWMAEHRVRQGDNIFSIARKYYVPPSLLASANNARYQDSLYEGRGIKVPLAAYNFLNARPKNPGEARPLYYRLTASDDLYRLSKLSRVPIKTFKEWNRIEDNKLITGSYVLVGWVRFDPTVVAVPARVDVVVINEKPSRDAVRLSSGSRIQVKDSSAKPRTDTVKTAAVEDTLSATEKRFNEQTGNGEKITTENGSAVFFNMPLNSGNEFYYAFHNTAPKGTIIRVVNPGNAKMVYVKVLGAMPNTKQYHNALIGISDRAKEALGAREDKLWCELSYALIN